MNKNLTEIAVVFDRSGSMSRIMGDALGALNTFIDQQKEAPGKANFSLMLFDDRFEKIYDRTKIRSVDYITPERCYARGMTALTDALCMTIDDLGNRLRKTPEADRPAKVIVCVITDGLENASKEFNKEQLQEKIEEQKNKYSWEFVFMMAGSEDALKQQADLTFGHTISVRNTVAFDSTADGYTTSFANLGESMIKYRSGDATDMSIRNT